MIQIGKTVLHLESLVDLLLILGDENLGLRMVEQILDLGSRVGRVYPHRDCTDRMGAELRPQPCLPILRVDGHLVTRSDPQFDESGTNDLDHFPVAGIGGLLPDPENLFAQSHFFWAGNCDLANLGGKAPHRELDGRAG